MWRTRTRTEKIETKTSCACEQLPSWRTIDVPHVCGENHSCAIVTWTCQAAHDSTFPVFTRRCFDCNLMLHQFFESLVELQFQAWSGVKMTIEFSSAFSTHWQIHCVWCCVCGKGQGNKPLRAPMITIVLLCEVKHDLLIQIKECRCGTTCASQIIRFARTSKLADRHGHVS